MHFLYNPWGVLGQLKSKSNLKYNRSACRPAVHTVHDHLRLRETDARAVPLATPWTGGDRQLATPWTGGDLQGDDLTMERRIDGGPFGGVVAQYGPSRPRQAP